MHNVNNVIDRTISDPDLEELGVVFDAYVVECAVAWRKHDVDFDGRVDNHLFYGLCWGGEGN